MIDGTPLLKGSGELSWAATVTVGDTWITILDGASVKVSEMLNLHATATPDTISRTGVVRVEAPGAINGVIDVVLHQLGGDSVADVPDGASINYFFVHQNAPNPFNPTTSIVLELPERRIVRLDVFEVAGRLVNRLIPDVSLGRGRHLSAWNGRDNRWRTVAADVYLYRLEAGEYSETKRMALVK